MWSYVFFFFFYESARKCQSDGHQNRYFFTANRRSDLFQTNVNIFFTERITSIIFTFQIRSLYNSNYYDQFDKFFNFISCIIIYTHISNNKQITYVFYTAKKESSTRLLYNNSDNIYTIYSMNILSSIQ